MGTGLAYFARGRTLVFSCSSTRLKHKSWENPSTAPQNQIVDTPSSSRDIYCS